MNFIVKDHDNAQSGPLLETTSIELILSDGRAYEVQLLRNGCLRITKSGAMVGENGIAISPEYGNCISIR